MLVLVSIRGLNVHSVFLSLELLQELPIIVLLAMQLILLLVLLLFRFGPIAIHTLSPAIISARIVLPWLLRNSSRVEVLDANVFLLDMACFVGRVEDVDCFVNVLLLFVLVDFTHIQLIHSQILLVLHLRLLLARR